MFSKTLYKYKKTNFKIIFLFSNIKNKIKNLIRFCSILTDNLFYEKEKQHQNFGLESKKNNTTVSIFFENTYLKKNFLGYNHKKEVFFKYSGMYKKLSWSIISSKTYITISLNQTNKNIFATENFAKLWKLKIHKNKYFKLIEIISDPTILIKIYKMIKTKPGNITVTQDNKFFKKCNNQWFEIITQKIKNGSFQFKFTQNRKTCKPSKPGLKLLTINNLKDKIIQQSIFMILEQIYESEFFSTSHGFRPSKGCHSALKQIKLNWSGISWFLKLNIYNCYKNINWNKLVNILCKKIDDQRFINLVHKLFNTNIIKFDIKGKNFNKGILEESILAPILCNIYLHKLDIEVKKIQKKYEIGKKKHFSTKYPYKALLYKTKEFLRLPFEKRKKIITKTKKNIHNLSSIHMDWNNKNFIRIQYIRYLDEILLGISGSKKLVEIIEKRLTNFIKFNLNLKLTKQTVIHITSGKLNFLGMEINAIPHSKFFKKFGKISENKKKINHRLTLIKNIKEAKLQKATQTVLKKTLRKNNFLNIKNSHKLKKKIWTIKKEVLLNEEFSKANIDTYRKFIKSLIRSKFFVPTFFKKTLTKLEKEIQKWEDSLKNIELENSKQYYKNFTNRCKILPFQINAPLKILREKLKSKKLISKANKPVAVNRLIIQPDFVIIKWFTTIGQSLLNYYRCCNNFHKVKNYVDYMVRWSAIRTLAAKHKISSKNVINKWSKNLIISDTNGHLIAKFPTNTEIKSMKRAFMLNVIKNTEALKFDIL